MTDDLGRVVPDDIAHLNWANDLGSEELQKRQRPIICYGSGSYARAIVLNGLLTGVCEGFNYGVGAGVRQVIKSFDLEDIGGRRMEAVWTFVKRVARIGSTISCSGALGNVISNYCEPNEEGSELVTRGGEAFGQDGDEYHVDPYEYGCGC
ncbi:hypothetical protein Slin15195_G036650 [Septoria linicola]|uniref:Uncharacterized protein n=1 Tax=Septoria linicola TaxID=215465 RepID=A0A9Q9AQS0_9PEZI|nr:hypothetical protein Slin15195_G036650 [Septoria linicola]